MIAHPHPKIKLAIVDTNVLAVIGMKNILQSVMPIAEVDTFASVAELEANHADSYFHFFVDVAILLQNIAFFTTLKHKVIVLTTSIGQASQLAGFHVICVNQPESQFVKDLLRLEQYAHAHGRNLPPVQKTAGDNLLSAREIEVLTLLVYGKTNKEIAADLSISITTVISHRKNIMIKLEARSLSALTIYAVMNGLVDVNRI